MVLGRLGPNATGNHNDDDGADDDDHDWWGWRAE